MVRTAVLVAAVVVLSACASPAEREVATGAGPSPSAAGGCPERYPGAAEEPWVPAPPSTETPGRLVPDADPVEALVCRYGDVFDTASAALEGEVLLEGGLDRVRTDLLVPRRVEGAQRTCTQIGGGFLPHLVRLRYADGELWLSAVQEPNRCSRAGNGDFISSAYLGDLFAQAHDSGTWPSPEPDPCAGGVLGRAGQERTLVPDGWTSLVVCDEGRSRREVDPDRAAQAVELLDQLETHPALGGCEGPATSVSRLVAGYPEGPPVVVDWLPGCRPPLSNGSLSAVPTPAQSELLQALLG